MNRLSRTHSEVSVTSYSRYPSSTAPRSYCLSEALRFRLQSKSPIQESRHMTSTPSIQRQSRWISQIALVEALKEGLGPSEAAKQAQKTGAKAAKLATRQAKRILGPIISSGWDFFEAIYYGGSMTEGFLRGVGTLFGTYVGGFHGEQRLGKLGYLGGSHLRSWFGGRVGLMIYGVLNGVSYLLQFTQQSEESSGAGSRDVCIAEETESYKRRAVDAESYEYTTPSEESASYESGGEDSGYYEPAPENTKSSSGWGIF